MHVDWSPLITPYCAEALREAVPNRGGLYVIWNELPDNTWACLYVGNSDCLLIDMALHLVSNREPLIAQIVTLTKSGFSFAVLENVAATAAASKHLHDVLQPRFSKDPKGMPMPINLPERRVVERPRPERRPGSDWLAKGVARAGAKIFQGLLRDWLGLG